MKNKAAVELGKSGGLKKSEKKTAACRKNASKPRSEGGRMEKLFIELAKFDEMLCTHLCSSNEYKVMKPIFTAAMKTLKDDYGMDYYDECEKRGFGEDTKI